MKSTLDVYQIDFDLYRNDFYQNDCTPLIKLKLLTCIS